MLVSGGHPTSTAHSGSCKVIQTVCFKQRKVNASANDGKKEIHTTQWFLFQKIEILVKE